MRRVLFALGLCYTCGNKFRFNPINVPSYSPTGQNKDRRPICEDCITVINKERQRRGLPPWVIPPDSYVYAEPGAI